jgi:hypothetical protein
MYSSAFAPVLHRYGGQVDRASPHFLNRHLSRGKDHNTEGWCKNPCDMLFLIAHAELFEVKIIS